MSTASMLMMEQKRIDAKYKVFEDLKRKSFTIIEQKNKSIDALSSEKKSLVGGLGLVADEVASLKECLEDMDKIIASLTEILKDKDISIASLKQRLDEKQNRFSTTIQHFTRDLDV